MLDDSVLRAVVLDCVDVVLVPVDELIVFTVVELLELLLVLPVLKVELELEVPMTELLEEVVEMPVLLVSVVTVEVLPELEVCWNVVIVPETVVLVVALVLPVPVCCELGPVTLVVEPAREPPGWTPVR